MKKSELLLPVGNMEMCLAAIHGGANAIYVGMPGFNARGRTIDHSFSDLEEMIKMCHLYGVKVHVAFNILIFQEEIEAAISALEKLLPLAPDAIIVQDLGLVNIIKSMNPKQVVHASTQMTVTNHDTIELLDDLDIERFVLGRENSIPEIKKIKENTNKELEVFVHGALCVAYSGQCFTSESIGGRSANRGQCAQSCRFEYEMFVDGEKKELVDQKYLVSPKDLCGINEVPELIDIGVDSFKVEGRLKSPYFVASAAKNYSDVINGHSDKSTKQRASEMAQTYSRGFFSGWLHGVDHQQLVDGTFGSNRGHFIGKVTSVDDKKVLVESTDKLDPGMGVLFARSERTNKVEIGANIYNVFAKRNSIYELKFSRDFDLSKVRVEDKVYINSNPKLNKEFESNWNDIEKQRKVSIEMTFEAKVGKNAVLTAVDENGNTVTAQGADLLEAAKKEVDLAKIEKDLTGLSRTIYKLENIEIEIGSEQPFLHNKMLKGLKREIVEKLNTTRTEVKKVEISSFNSPEVIEKSSSPQPKLNILLREIQQVKDLVSSITDRKYLNSVILDFEFGKDYQEAIDILLRENITSAIATNRILKPGEYHHLKNIIRLNPDYVLIRNLGAFNFLKKLAPEKDYKADFCLNVANSKTADYLFDKGLTSLTPSYDLNQDQVLNMIKYSKKKSFEVTIHQYMPSFHMEHCVYAAFLSNGSSFKDCGKPCEKHKLELKDQFGNSHFIKADSECRNTMFNATPQSASAMYENLIDLGVSEFRYEALFELGKDLETKVKSYLDFVAGLINKEELSKTVGVMEKYGLSSGRLLVSDNYVDRKKD